MKRQQNIPAPVQQLIEQIEQQDLILAEVSLPEIPAMPDYDQILRVQDNNIALSIGYLKINPKRILVHKTTGEELDLNLPVPLWEKNEHDVAALVDEQGERILVDTNYYDNVETAAGYYDEETQEYIPAVYEEQLIETKQEPVLVHVLKYLMLIISQKKYKEVFAMFTQQYIADTLAEDPTYYSRLR